MFEFDRLILSNFAIYSSLELDLSPAEAGPLGPRDSVLIRGHNEHGKTTMFRGLLWTLFGKEALDTAEKLSAWEAMRLAGLEGQQEHMGQLIFRTDATKYRITRRAVTTPDSRVSETTRVHRFNPADSEDPWKEDPAVERTLSELYFPPSLAPYLFLNADKVSSIVGDSGSAARQSDEVTHAINEMLGITAVNMAILRVKRQRKEIEAVLQSKLGSNNERNKLISAVERLEGEVKKQEGIADEAGQRIAALNDQLDEREFELRGLEDADTGTAVYARFNDAKFQMNTRSAAYRDAMKELRGDFSSEALYVPFFTSQLQQVNSRLSALQVEGVIPQTELPLLTKLLNPVINPEALCICRETDIHPGTSARATLEQLVEASRQFEKGADRLDKIRGDLLELLKAHTTGDKDASSRFGSRISGIKAAKLELEAAQSELEDAKQARDQYEAAASAERIRMVRGEVADLREQSSKAKMQQNVALAKLEGGSDSLGISHGDGLRRELHSARRKLSAYYATVKDSQHLAKAVKAAERVVDVLEETVRSIQVDQVAAVSAQMNHLFLTITNNGADLLLDERGVLQVTSKVGVREVPSRTGSFELYAESAQGVAKPLAVLNGASRQALTVSFMVALLETSGAPIPLVTDSIFHPLSGNVKFRLAKHLLAPKVQKITFFTHDDVQTPQVRDLLAQRAAHTYTISNSAKPQDLANPPHRAPDSVAMVCTCGPGEFCDTCQLAALDGPSATDGLERNPSPTRVL
jgi:DNA sulfur modification protein DndD